MDTLVDDVLVEICGYTDTATLFMFSLISRRYRLLFTRLSLAPELSLDPALDPFKFSVGFLIECCKLNYPRLVDWIFEKKLLSSNKLNLLPWVQPLLNQALTSSDSLESLISLAKNEIVLINIFTMALRRQSRRIVDFVIGHPGETRHLCVGVDREDFVSYHDFLKISNRANIPMDDFRLPDCFTPASQGNIKMLNLLKANLAPKVKRDPEWEMKWNMFVIAGHSSALIN